jgi:hypothetical protein
MDGGHRFAAAETEEQLRETFAGTACSQLGAAVEAATKIHRDQTGGYQ